MFAMLSVEPEEETYLSFHVTFIIKLKTQKTKNWFNIDLLNE